MAAWRIAVLKAVYGLSVKLSGMMVTEVVNVANLSLKSDFASLFVLIFSQSMIDISSRCLLNFIDVSLNLATTAVWSLRTPDRVT